MADGQTHDHIKVHSEWGESHALLSGFNGSLMPPINQSGIDMISDLFSLSCQYEICGAFIFRISNKDLYRPTLIIACANAPQLGPNPCQY